MNYLKVFFFLHFNQIFNKQNMKFKKDIKTKVFNSYILK